MIAMFWTSLILNPDLQRWSQKPQLQEEVLTLNFACVSTESATCQESLIHLSMQV